MVFPDEQTGYSNGVLQAVLVMPAFAPRLWAYEVRNSVLVGRRRGRISEEDARSFLASIEDLNVRLTDPVSYDKLFELAGSHRLTVYDAAYLDLAMREGAQLATLDAELRRAAAEPSVPVYAPAGPLL